jgi:hypothetical protein
MNGRRSLFLTIAVISSLVAGAASSARPARAQLVDRYTVQFAAGAFELAENGGAAVVTLQRTDALGLPLGLPILSRSTVRFRTADGTATAPSDYQAVDVTVEFRGTETTKTVTVPLAGDGRYEHHETVSLWLSEPTGAKLGPQSNATLTILNDDAPPVVSVSAPEPVVEGTPVTFTVALSEVSDVPATVSYATGDGSATAWADYQPASGTVTVPAGSTSVEIAVATVDDQTTEEAESFLLGISHPVYSTLGSAHAVATINDDDVAVLLSVADPAPAPEGEAVTFVISLSRPTTERVLVDYATEDQSATSPADYESRSGTATIDPGQTEATVVVPTRHDLLVEDTETFLLRLWNPRGAGIADGTAVGRITDSVVNAVATLGDALSVVEGGVAVFPLTLSRAAPAPVEFIFSVVSGTATVGLDLPHPPSPLRVTFQAGDTVRYVSVPTTDDSFREDPETFELVMAEQAGYAIGRGRATAYLIDNDQCRAVGPTERRHILNSWLARLDPDGDEDGDGFTNGEELGALAFDPVANPTRFNPLIADIPRFDIEVNDDLSIALYDTAALGQEIGRLHIREDELARSVTNSDTRSTVEASELGFSAELGGDSKAGVKLGFEYKLTKTATDERKMEVSSARRELRRQELNEVLTSETVIGGGVLAVTVTLRNTGDVAFRLERAGLVLRSVDASGKRWAFDTLTPNFDFGEGPTLAPGQEKDILFTVDGIGASDAIALMNDASELEIGLGSDFELSHIAVGARDVGAGNFAQYQNQIMQNTAAVNIDYGPGRVEKHLVSTSFMRDGHGRPLGLALCDVLQILLQRTPTLFPEEELVVETRDGQRVATGRAALLRSLTTGGPSPVFLYEEAKARNAYWITEADAASVGGRRVFGPGDVYLRARQGAHLVYFKDQDGDGVEHREEHRYGTSDTNVDSDGDGLSDWQEINQSWQIVVPRIGGAAEFVYDVRSDPGRADADGDGLPDLDEKARGTDPWLQDTDRDGMPDLDDVFVRRNGLLAEWFKWAGGDDRPTGNGERMHSEIVPNVDVDWGDGTNSPGGPHVAVGSDRFISRWTGLMAVPRDGTYYFGGLGDDGFSVIVNGLVLTDNWNRPDLRIGEDYFGSALPGSPPWGLTLKANQPVQLTVLHFEKDGHARMHLKYYTDADPTVRVVPSGWLAPPGIEAQGATGLTGQYFYDANKNWTFDDDERALASVIDQEIRHNWGSDPPLEHVPWDNFMVRWTGSVGLPAGADDDDEGEYEFGIRGDDGFRMWLGDEEIISNWTDGGKVDFTWSRKVQLSAGERHSVKIEYYENSGNASIELRVRPAGEPSKAKTVPRTWLSPNPDLALFGASERSGGWVTVRANQHGHYAGFLEVKWNGGGCGTPVVGRVAEGRFEEGCSIPKSAFDIRVEVIVDADPDWILDVLSFPYPKNVCIQFEGSAGRESYSRCE